MKDTTSIEISYTKAVSGIKEVWLTDGDDNWYRYITNLPKVDKYTYLIIVFEDQVLNGGFHQYYVNGYGQFSKETIEAMLSIGASKKAEILKTAFQYVNSNNLSEEIFRKLLLEKAISPLFYEDALFEKLDDLDNKYYAIHDEDLILLLKDYLLMSE